MIPPLSPTRLLGELVVGMVLGSGGFLLGAYAGNRLGNPSKEGCLDTSECLPTLAFGAGLGYMLVMPLGVSFIGSLGNQRGSVIAAYVGSALGGLPGLVWIREDALASMLVTPIGATLGAIIAFNLTRRYGRARTAPVLGSLVRIDRGVVSLGAPIVTRGESHGRPTVTMALITGSF